MAPVIYRGEFVVEGFGVWIRIAEPTDERRSVLEALGSAALQGEWVFVPERAVAGAARDSAN